MIIKQCQIYCYKNYYEKDGTADSRIKYMRIHALQNVGSIWGVACAPTTKQDVSAEKKERIQNWAKTILFFSDGNRKSNEKNEDHVCLFVCHISVYSLVFQMYSKKQIVCPYSIKCSIPSRFWWCPRYCITAKFCSFL